MALMIPPPVLLLITALLMWWVSNATPALILVFPFQALLSYALLVAALTLMFAAAWRFLRARTSINPMRPDAASNLITDGVFRISRNPIYLADALLLTAYAVWMGNPLCIPLLAGFIWYITCFQIRPEEHALAARFGDAYTAYSQRVRRWL